MPIIITRDGASGSATITGTYKERSVTIASVGQTTQGRVFEVDPETFRALKKRIGISGFANQFQLSGDPSERPVTIRTIQKRFFR